MKKLETAERHGVMWKPPMTPTEKPKPNPSALTEHGVDLTIPTERISIFGLPQDTRAETQSEDNVNAWRRVFRDMAVDAVHAEQRRQHEHSKPADRNR